MNRLIVVLVLGFVLIADTIHAANLELKEIARVGQFDGAPEYMFGSVAHGGILSNGSAVIHDRQMHEVRVYDEAGIFVGRIGSVGEGPGEFIDIRGLIVTLDDKVVTLSRPSVVTIYDGEARTYETSFLTPGGLHAPHMLDYDTDGHIYIRGLVSRPKQDEEWDFEWAIYDRTGKSVGVLDIPPENASHEAFVLVRPEGWRFSFPVRTETALSREGTLIIGRSDDYDILWADSDSAVHFRNDGNRLPIEGPERKRYLDLAKQFEGDEHPIPEYKPYFRAIHVGPSGAVWVERYAIAEPDTVVPNDGSDSYVDWHEPNVYDIFDPTGRLLGTIRILGLARLVGFRGSDLWGVDSTDSGEQLVHWKIVLP